MYYENSLITLDDPKSPVSEAYRVLRTNIQFMSVDKPIKSIVVSSATPEEGKSSTLANLAVIMAQAGSRTLIIDGDLRKPMVHKLFNLDNRKGLTNVLALHEDYQDYLHKGPHSNLDILTCGAIPPNPSELLASAAMKEFLSVVGSQYDYILIDAPPIGAVTDAAILSTIVDGVILVAASGQVRGEFLQRAKEQLEQVNANILGVVLNKVTDKIGSSYGYYYYYRYGQKQKGRKSRLRNTRKATKNGLHI
ncbi:MAG: CpsD/CapB family tyrosine-protein kinase [Eubacteriales bacterium]|nr:CpsD/CapB family tyrosine-protein kinase [Eubacteriales bacterium]